MKIKNPAKLRERLAAWFKLNGRDLPWRRTQDPYAIMVSEFMLQQTQVATVIPYFERWLKKFPNFQVLARASEDEVLAAWQGLGYYSRARNLHRAAQEVVVRFGGNLPGDLQAIAELPGIGRYTLGAIASFAFDRPTATVDANIARVLCRLANVEAPIDSPAGSETLWMIAETLLPKSGGNIHTSALMELGALVCTSSKPQCLLCPVQTHCTSKDPESLPRKKPRRKVVELQENCGWILFKNCVLLEQQTGSRWRGMWKLPAIDSGAASGPALLCLDYPFTHHRVHLSIFASAKPSSLKDGQRWFDVTELEWIAMPSPHRRALLKLLKTNCFKAEPSRKS